MAKAQEIVKAQQETAEAIQESAKRESMLVELQNTAQNLQMQVENMANLNLMADNAGWVEIGQYATDGPRLEQLQSVAAKLRNLSALNSHIGRGKRLRYSYVWEGGIKHDGIPEGGKQGVPDVKKVIADPVNQANFFGASARERQEAALYTNGMYVVIGEDSTRGTPKRLRQLPLYQITGAMVNPDDPTEIWALRRSWSPDAIIGTQVSMSQIGSGALNDEWIYLNEHKDKQRAKVKYNGGDEDVATNKRIFMEQVNRQDGWTWGLPDAVAAFAWADQYRRGLLNGLKMQEALATIAFRLKAQTQKGANNAAAKVASSTEKGGTAAMTEGMDISALATAGQGYDFDSLRPILAAVSTALDVSVVALSSDPGAAGSSYGSAQTLDGPTRLAMEARRLVHVDFEREILKWLGASEAKIWFDSMIDWTEVYRGIQSVILKWNTGLYTPEEAKKELESIVGHEVIGDIPADILLPNNAKSLNRRDIDADGEAPASTPSANQGVSNGTGGDGEISGNDVRTDQIS